MATVDIREVRKAFGSTQVLHGVSVGIEDGQFVVLVGPSGCGKSTLLRMLAGLENITGGEIAIGGRVVNNVPPKDRDIAMVFQNYALYPHMTVFQNMAFLIVMCLAPAIGLLMVFLTYPLGLGVWLAFTDTTIGQRGIYVGLENFEFLFGDPIFWNAVFFSVFYTGVATVGKFGLGLWLALLLNNHLPFKSFLRAIILLPWIVPTVLSAIAFWWIYDPQFSIISWMFIELGLRETNIDFINTAWPARWSLIAANIWRGIPFVAISLLAGLQTISPSLYEAAMLDGATAWQRFRYVTFPMLLPILAIVMTFSIIFTFTDFQLVYAITRGGPVNSTHLLATLAFQRGIPGGQLGEGAAIAVSMVPFLVFATLFSYFALARRKWQQGESND